MANPTPDSQMNGYLAQIAEAKKGKEVRSAIYGGLERTFNKSYEWADQANRNANTALSNSTQALNTITSMAEDISEVNEEAQQMSQEYNEISARVDNIIAHNQDTSSNTELIDIRTCQDGYVAGTAGTAVRRQVTGLNTRINNIVLDNPRSYVSVNQPASVVYTEVWTNSSPSSSFAGQTITFTEVEGTAEYLIEYAEIALNDPPVFSDKAAVPSEKRITALINGVYGLVGARRDFAVEQGSIIISDCRTIVPNNPFSLSGTDMTIEDPSVTDEINNNYLIPIKIYAVQHVLTGTLQISKDTEVIDARVGADGVTYQTLGDAIRTQISEYIAAGVLDALSNLY